MQTNFKKSIIIIGKTGQLGASLMKQASLFGYHAIGYGRDELDIRDSTRICKEIVRIQPRIVINASAYHIVRECEKHPDIAKDINRDAVEQLARMCVANNVMMVHYSTDYVFDGTKGVPYTEDDKPQSLEVYGVSKWEGEQAALAIHPAGAYIIRTAGLYGGKEGSKMKGGNFVLNILRDIALQDGIEVGSDQTTSTSFSDDVAKGTYQLFEKRAPADIYHLINEGSCGWHEFAQEIVRLARSKASIIPVVRGEMQAGIRRPLYSVLANTRAKAYGIILPGWQDALARYMSFLENSASIL